MRSPTIISNAKRFLDVTVMFAVLLSITATAAATYDFKSIVDTSGEYRWFGGQWSINDQGMVGFGAQKYNRDFVIQTWKNGQFSEVYHSRDIPNLWADSVQVNNAGSIAFGGTAANHGVYVGNGGPLTSVVDDSGVFANPILLRGG